MKATTLTSLQFVFLPASFFSCLTLFCSYLTFKAPSQSQARVSLKERSQIPRTAIFLRAESAPTVTDHPPLPMTSLLQNWGWPPRIAILYRGEAAPVSTDHTPPRQQSFAGVRLHPQVQVIRSHSLVMVFCGSEVVLEQANHFIASRLLAVGKDFFRRASNKLIRWTEANGEKC